MASLLHLAALWVRDWVLTAVHDPDFPKFSILTVRLLQCNLSCWNQSRLNHVLEFSFSLWLYPRVRLHHPRDWTDEWGRAAVDYTYPITITEGAKKNA